MNKLLLILALISTPAFATTCDEWANFTKIITYKAREEGMPRAEVKRRTELNSPNPTENIIAFKWIDYTYDNPNMSPVDVWENVYAQCLVKYSI
jgi:hypothetical protein